MITLWRIIQSGVRNFLRNAWLSTAATAVMIITLTMILISYISNVTLVATLKGFVNKIDVSVYLKDTVTPDQVRDLQNRVLGQPNVLSVKYISKADALAIYRQQNQYDKSLLNAISEADNPLPQSLQVKAKDPNKLDPIVAFFGADDIKPLLQDKNAVSYSGERKKAVDRIVGFINFMKRAGLTMSLVFTVISVLIIFNTIRMTIFTRREEIEIMKLVGATKWFIRGPFLFEAALYGIVAAIIATGVVYALIVAAGPKLGSYVDINSAMAIFKHYPVLVILAETGVGLAIGTASSMLAMTRYLKL